MLGDLLVLECHIGVSLVHLGHGLKDLHSTHTSARRH